MKAGLDNAEIEWIMREGIINCLFIYCDGICWVVMLEYKYIHVYVMETLIICYGGIFFTSVNILYNMT
jgi:hypothetical protein